MGARRSQAGSEADGRNVYDFGQNAGVCIRIHVKGEARCAGSLEHSEVLGPDRFFDNRNYRSARAELVYTLSGEAEGLRAASLPSWGSDTRASP